MKTVMLQGKRVTDRVFTADQLERLMKLGALLTWNAEEFNPTKELTMELIRGAEVVITSWGCPPLDAEILDQAPNLKAVLHAAGSVKPVVTPELWQRGIQVTSGASILSRGVGETALGLTIMSLKNIWRVAEETKRSGWWGFAKDDTRNSIREMYGSTIGCIGAGNAGRHYVKLLKHFQVEVLLADPTYTKEQAQELGATLVTLEELLSRSDVVTVLAPEIPATYRMINDERLGLMKEGATLVNLARGSLIDEDALIRHLRTNRISACLDVTDPEPPTLDHPFRHLPNVILTGHIAGAVNNGLLAIGEFIVDEWDRLHQGLPLIAAIDRTKLHELA
ncbi:Glycerate dehydrogenase [compost metagenome]